MIEIDKEHTDFRRQQLTFQMYRDLYAGGHQFKERAAHYLLRRQKEPLDVYAERLARVFYQNYIGSIIDWYGSTLFRREPSLHYESGLQSGRNFCLNSRKIATDAAIRLPIFSEVPLSMLW